MNNDARVKLYFHEAKLCICLAWFLVHFPSHWTKEHCVEVGVMYAAPSVFFSFLQKVSEQQILERCMKDFVFGFVAHIHALTEIQIQKIYLAWIPKCLPSSSFMIFFSRERFWKGFFTVHHFFRKSQTRLS